ncbi:GmrSD restriction endonuclease domain-containing protein [Pseudoclavibacter soli]|uniref:GmrSD restriction endonuclease domain-containing protein n=1 Tax=Pseudoclavibacter soli TaxID=452623 RepID=UPI00042A920D|nr:DUF1524 domain-containing protein [Pseudoclavibacter soli]
MRRPRHPRTALLTVVIVAALAVAGVSAAMQSNHDSAETAATSVEVSSSPSTEPDDAEGDEPDAADDGEVVQDLSASAATTGSAFSSSAQTTSTALELLQSLPVKGRAPKTGYARDQFSSGWKDPDRNGCDARNDMLARDLTDVTRDGPCKVLTGTLDDPYTGTVISFVRGNSTSTAVQIDHLVSLSNAWQTGAQQLTADQRLMLANDPLNLQSVDGPTNRKKGAGDAATWLPPQKSYRCEYVSRQVSVKAAYGLWVTQAEKDAIIRVLDVCPGQIAYQSALSPYTYATSTATAPSAETQTDSSSAASTGNQQTAPQTLQSTPTPAQTESGGSVSYRNCTEARAAGVTPIYRGQPGYAAKLDRDGDGVACE